MFTALSGYLYRMGGSEDKPEWMWKARDVGCNIAILLWLYFAMGILHWVEIFCFGLMWASFSSYFNKDDAQEHWWNFSLHGFFIGLSLFPLCITNDISWASMTIRSLALFAFMGLWSLHKNAIIEESGRGAAVILTLLLLT